MHTNFSAAAPGPQQQQIQSHRDLIVWQKSMRLAVAIYRLTARFPSREAFNLVAQMTRSAASVPANIAEGHARGTQKDYCHFLAIAKGSLVETETFALLPIELGYVNEEDADVALGLMTEVRKMLTVLRRRLVGR